MHNHQLRTIFLCAHPRISGFLLDRFSGDSEMEAVWGAVLSFLFVLATLSGYGRGTPQIEKQKSEQSDKQDEDKDKNKNKEEESNKSNESPSKGKAGKTEKGGKSGQKNKGSSTKGSTSSVEYCVKDCPEAWRIRP